MAVDAGGAPGRRRDARADAGHDDAPRPRRRGAVGRARARGRARFPTARDRRSLADGEPADDERGRHRPGRLQRRDLQPPRIAQGAPREGAPLQDRPLRHRGDRPRLRGVGRGRRRAHPRDVRDRDLGREGAPAVPGARPRRDQAALLLVDTRRLPVRLRDQGAARAPRRHRRRRAALGLPLPLVPDDACSAHDVPRRLQDARGLPRVREAGRLDEGRGLLGRAARAAATTSRSCGSSAARRSATTPCGARSSSSTPPSRSG